MPARWLRQALPWIYNRLLPAALSVSVLYGLWWYGQNLEASVYDLWCRWSAAYATRSPVVLVLIDDESIARLGHRFGPMPWPREAYLQILQAVQAQSPAVMVLDAHFVSFSQSKDRSFLQGLRQFPELIGGLALPESAGGSWEASPEWMASVSSLKLGVVSMPEDPDGVIRRLRPFVALPPAWAQGAFSSSSPGLPALATQGAAQFWRRTHPDSQWTLQVFPQGQTPWLGFGSPRGRGLSLNVESALPLAHDLSFQLRWYRILNPDSPEYARSHPAIPLWRFFEPGQPASVLKQLRGGVALIGSSSSMFRDFHRTPMAYRHLGPDIQATAIDNILMGQAPRRTSSLLNALVTGLLVLVVLGLRLRLRSLGKTLLYTTGSMVLYCWLAFWLFAHHSLWLDVVTPEVFMVAAFLTGSTYRSLFKEQQLATLERREKSLAQLVDPEVLREIRRQSHVLKPSGEKVDITSMFVDIRNFTTIAERLSAQEVTALLNQFYGLVVTLVFRHQGTVDKFMGDGILIIFGAPLPNPNHRWQALQAALEILRETAVLAGDWQSKLGLETDIGITLNSGTAFVGFLGPPNKLEYTAVGDTVNICVRLQEQAKQLQTRLLMSETTLAQEDSALPTFPDAPPWVDLGFVSVRGREGCIRVLTVPEARIEIRGDAGPPES